MTFLKGIPFWIALLIITLTLDSQLYVFTFHFNLTVLVVYYLSITKKQSTAFLWSLMIGLLIDSISLTLIGPHILSKGVVSLVSSMVRSRIFLWTTLLNALLCASITVIDGSITFIALTLFSNQPSEILYALYLILFQAIINGMITFAIRVP